MKKNFTLFLFVLAIISCKNNSETENNVATVVSESIEEKTQSNSINDQSDSNRKIIDTCKKMEGIIDADIVEDKLSLRANISKVEAQKLSEGMLIEVRKYNQIINSVIIFDVNYDLVGYSDKK